MGLPNVVFTVTDNGLGRRNPTDDNVGALVMTGVAAGDVDLGDPYMVKSLAEAEALGITSAYDEANTVLVWYHIREFFKVNPDGELWFILKSQATTMETLADKNTANGLKLLLTTANGRVRFIGVARNPASGYTPTLANGLDADVVAAVAKAQEFAEEEFDRKRPVQFLIEGRSLNGTLTSAKDLRTLGAEYVSVVIGQDYEVADGDALFNGMACVGTTLGMICKAKVNENIGWPEKFKIDYDGVNWQYPALSNHVKIEDVKLTDMDALDVLGYIMPRRFTGLSGTYFNDSHTCTVITSDYAYIENVRTINKAVREAYAALVTKLNSPLNVDPLTGKIASETIKYFEQLVASSLDEMGRNGEISVSNGVIGRDVYIDPDQNILSTSELSVKISIVPTATGRSMQVTIGLATSI
jgi:hypothetical protein